eukprot:CAMPEP_0201544852 /NCGR_PEP_ID=MMETSP0173_2-20130828/1467_1 /ASSEMBLY_ACC=CAM_ASM_000268 /TAXON_ID=218659 /ORGANISM="Vexillifera sp., Strain DIVA3 564/2" /LENGTH=593 /DNA_ID=CAMNT_0047953121 /DNA_START=39 /DNA_END=1817 /DNA_ORIENTATION=-
MMLNATRRHRRSSTTTGCSPADLKRILFDLSQPVSDCYTTERVKTLCALKDILGGCSMNEGDVNALPVDVLEHLYIERLPKLVGALREYIVKARQTLGKEINNNNQHVWSCCLNAVWCITNLATCEIHSILPLLDTMPLLLDLLCLVPFKTNSSSLQLLDQCAFALGNMLEGCWRHATSIFHQHCSGANTKTLFVRIKLMLGVLLDAKKTPQQIQALSALTQGAAWILSGLLKGTSRLKPFCSSSSQQPQSSSQQSQSSSQQSQSSLQQSQSSLQQSQSNNKPLIQFNPVQCIFQSQITDTLINVIKSYCLSQRHVDTSLFAELTWLMTYISAQSNQDAQLLHMIKSLQVPLIFTQVAQYKQRDVEIGALRVIGNLTAKPHPLMQKCLNVIMSNYGKHLLELIREKLSTTNQHRVVVGECVWILANITFSNDDNHKWRVSDAPYNFVPILCKVLCSYAFDVRKEAAFALCNLLRASQAARRKALLTTIVSPACVQAYMELIRSLDPAAVDVSIQFASFILEHHPKGKCLVFNADGIDALESLPMDHPLFRNANALVDRYYTDVPSDDDIDQTVLAFQSDQPLATFTLDDLPEW